MILIYCCVLDPLSSAKVHPSPFLSLSQILGTYWEPDGNPLEARREHVGNKGKMKKRK
jgi:hypothetical protein